MKRAVFRLARAGSSARSAPVRGAAQVLITSAVAFVAACSQVQDFRTEPVVSADAGASVTPMAACGTVDDPENCGVCGHSCGGGECQSGVCQPFVLAEHIGLDPGNTQITDQGAFGIAADDDAVYFMDSWSTLYRVPATKGGVATPIAQTKALPSVLRVRDKWLYFAGNDPPIGRVRTVGGSIDAVSPAGSDPNDDYAVSFALDGEAVVWVDFGKRVHRCPVVGSSCANPELVRDYGALYAGKVHPVAVAASRGRVYVSYYRDADSGGQSFAIDNITGAGIVPALPIMYSALIAEPMRAAGDPTDYDRVFAIGDHAIVTALTLGDMVSTVLASGKELDTFPQVVLDGDYLYWTNHKVFPNGAMSAAGSDPPASYGSIMRVRKDGTKLPETLYRTTDGLHEIAVHGDRIYFTSDAGQVLALVKPPDGKTDTR